jgi:hypothetical protein
MSMPAMSSLSSRATCTASSAISGGGMKGLPLPPSEMFDLKPPSCRLALHRGDDTTVDHEHAHVAAVAGFNVLLKQEIRCRGDAVEQIGEIIEIASRLLQSMTPAPRVPRNFLTTTGKPSSRSMKFTSAGNLPRIVFGIGSFAPPSTCSVCSLSATDSIAAGLLAMATPWRSKWRSTASVKYARLTAAARNDEVRLVELAALIDRGPGIIGVDDEIEFARFQHQEFDVERPCGFLKAHHLGASGTSGLMSRLKKSQQRTAIPTTSALS